MKLSSLYKILNEADLLITPDVKTVTRNNVDFTTIKNATSVRAGLNRIIDSGIFQLPNNLTKIIQSNSAFYDIDHPDGQNVLADIAELQRSLSLLLRSLVVLAEEEEPMMFYFKLPRVRDLEDLQETNKILNTILSQSILDPEIGGRITFLGVESGTSWYKIGVGTVSALTLIASMYWSALVIYKKQKEADYLYQVVRTQEIVNDHKKQVVDDFQKLMSEALLDMEARHVYNDSFATFDNERFTKIKYCLDLLANEVSKGAEIQPALTAPENVSQLFPDIKYLPTLKSKIPEITNGH